ncbi:MAG: hypothetical protein RBR06_10990 [Desulfuromonadaceae bacterium]|nr:hypothetical protein [Desulfuromonadaceae bacterium]
MKYIAYAIWGGLGICLSLGVILSVYAKFRAYKDRIRTAEPLAPEPDLPILSEKRWSQLVDMLHLQDCTVPVDAAERVVWAHDNLGIEKDWLQGWDSAMYPLLSFHNAVGKGIEFIHTLKQQHIGIVLYVVKTCGTPLAEDIMEAGAVLCFATPAGIAGCSAQHFYPVNVYWEWGYPPERVQCSQIIYAAIQTDIEVRGVEVEQGDMYALLEGKNIPSALVQNTTSSWDPCSVASAGEDLCAVKKGMVSAQDLKQQLGSGSETHIS